MIIAAISTLITFVSGIFSGLFSTVITALSNTWNAIVNAAGVFRDAFVAAFAFIGNLIKGYFDFIVNVITTGWEIVKAVFSTVGEFLWNVVTDVFQTIVNIVQTLWNTFVSIVTNGWNFIKNVFIGAFNALVNIITNGFSLIRNIFTGAFGFMKNVVTGIFDPIKNVFTSGFEFIKNAMSQFIQGLKKIWGGIANVFIKPVFWVIDTVLNKGLISSANWVLSKVGLKQIPHINFSYLNPFAEGGAVPGVGDKDSVPAILTPGEFVIKKSAVKKIGLSKLYAMNEGRIVPQQDESGNKHYLFGGVVDAVKNVGGAAIGLVKGAGKGILNGAQFVGKSALAGAEALSGALRKILAKGLEAAFNGILGLLSFIPGDVLGIPSAFIRKLAKTLVNFVAGKDAEFAQGGLVPGVGDKDTVPARLTPGEFVLKKKAVKRIGVARLQVMNEDPQKFAEGGEVKKKGSARDAGNLSTNTLNQNISNAVMLRDLIETALSEVTGKIAGPKDALTSKFIEADSNITVFKGKGYRALLDNFYLTKDVMKQVVSVIQTSPNSVFRQGGRESYQKFAFDTGQVNSTNVLNSARYFREVLANNLINIKSAKGWSGSVINNFMNNTASARNLLKEAFGVTINLHSSVRDFLKGRFADRDPSLKNIISGEFSKDSQSIFDLRETVTKALNSNLASNRDAQQVPKVVGDYLKFNYGELDGVKADQKDVKTANAGNNATLLKAIRIKYKDKYPLLWETLKTAITAYETSSAGTFDQVNDVVNKTRREQISIGLRKNAIYRPLQEVNSLVGGKNAYNHALLGRDIDRTNQAKADIMNMLGVQGFNLGGLVTSIPPSNSNLDMGRSYNESSTAVTNNRGFTVEQLNINNPRAETSSDTLPRTIRKLAYLSS